MLLDSIVALIVKVIVGLAVALAAFYFQYRRDRNPNS